MANSFVVYSAPNTVVLNAPVGSAAGGDIETAIRLAQPGTTILVQTPGDPQSITLTNEVKADPGVLVLLHPDQKVTYRADGGSPNVHFQGGNWAADDILGLVSTSYSFQMLNGARKASLRGANITQNRNAFVIGTGCGDVIIENNLINYCRSDVVTTSGASRLVMRGNVGTESLKGYKTGIFLDGSKPLYSVSKSETKTAAGGGDEFVTWDWFDAPHSDILQARQGSYDFTVENNVFRLESQGFVDFDLGSYAGPFWHRFSVVGNKVWTTEASGFNFKGSDLYVAYNSVFDYPGISDQLTKQFAVGAHNGTAIRGGGNFSSGAATNPTGVSVNLFAPTINGPAVVSPEQPRIVDIPWRPTAVRPSAGALPAIKPEIVIAPDILWIAKPRGSGTQPPTPLVTPVTDTWLAMNFGQVKTYGKVVDPAVDYEWQWKRNGTIIATGQTYRVTAADVGTSITGEIRARSIYGWGDWKSSTAITPAAA